MKAQWAGRRPRSSAALGLGSTLPMPRFSRGPKSISSRCALSPVGVRGTLPCALLLAFSSCPRKMAFCGPHCFHEESPVVGTLLLVEAGWEVVSYAELEMVSKPGLRGSGGQGCGFSVRTWVWTGVSPQQSWGWVGAGVLVSQGCSDNIPRPSDVHVSSPGGWNPDPAVGGAGPPGASLLGVEMAVSSPGPHRVIPLCVSVS